MSQFNHGGSQKGPERNRVGYQLHRTPSPSQSVSCKNTLASEKAYSVNKRIVGKRTKNMKQGTLDHTENTRRVSF